MTKLYNIQILRAVAVLAVLFYHLKAVSYKFYTNIDFPEFTSFGSGGVDLFFVISGFIIILVNHNKESGVKYAASFLLKRLIRIFPIYWVYSLSVLIVYLFYPNLVNNSQNGEINFLLSFFLIPHDTLPLLMVGWSLSYELYFYLLVTLMICFFKWIYFKYILFFILCTILVNVVYEIFENSISLNFLLNPYIIEFVIGAFVSYIYVISKERKLDYVCLIMLILTLGFLLYSYDMRYGYELKRVIIFGIPSTLLLIFALILKSQQNNFVGKYLSNIGEWSYSIYLSHILVINSLGILFDMLININNVFMDICKITLTVLFVILTGKISYEVFEKKMCSFLIEKFKYIKLNYFRMT